MYRAARMPAICLELHLSPDFIFFRPPKLRYLMALGRLIVVDPAESHYGLAE